MIAKLQEIYEYTHPLVGEYPQIRKLAGRQTLASFPCGLGMRLIRSLSAKNGTLCVCD